MNMIFDGKSKFLHIWICRPSSAGKSLAAIAWWCLANFLPPVLTFWTSPLSKPNATFHVTLSLTSPMMSLPIRYSPMPVYFWLSIIFLTPQILQHLPRQHDLSQLSCEPSCDHHWLCPIPIAPSVQYHVGDLPYDPRTTSLHFPFLVSSLLPHTFVCSLTNHRLSRHVIGTLPYVSPPTNLVLVLLIVCI